MCDPSSYDEYSNGCCGVFFSMLTLCTRSVVGSGDGEGSSSASGAEQLDDQTWEFSSFDITCSILDQTHVIFRTIKDGIFEVLDESLSAFRIEVADMMGL